MVLSCFVEFEPGGLLRLSAGAGRQCGVRKDRKPPPEAMCCKLSTQVPGLQWSLESGGAELSVPPASRYSSLDPDGQLGDGPGSPQFSSTHLLRH